MLVLQVLSIELLGNSQTFLGTLATLIVLCIFSNENNFIYQILKKVVENFQNEIKLLQINTDFKNITDSGDYKLLTRVVKDPCEDVQLKNDGVKLISKISNCKLKLQLEYAPVESFGDRQIVDIENSKEQILAPLYTFGFCMMMFVFDEIFRVFTPSVHGLCCSVLAVFIAFSFIFWIFIWGRFISKNYGRKAQDVCREEWMQTETDDIGKKRKWYVTYKGGIIVLLMVTTVLFFFTAYSSHFYYPYTIVISFVLPFLLMGIWKMFVRRSGYSYMFVFKHFLCILVLSILLCWLFFYFFLEEEDGYELFSFSFHWFKASIFVFIFFNGLIFPFLMPYLCYFSIYREARNNVKRSKDKADEMEREIRQDLKEFSRRVKP